MSLNAVGNLDTSFNVGRGQTSETDFKAAVDRSRLGVPQQGGNAELDNLLRQLISVLQPSPQIQPREPLIPMGPGPVVHPGREGGHGPVVPSGSGPNSYGPLDHGPIEGGHGPVVPGGSDATGKLLEHVISLLNAQLVSGKLDPEQAGLVAKLLPLLEQKLVSNAQAKGSPDSETALLGKLVSALGGDPAAPAEKSPQLDPIGREGADTSTTTPAKAKTDASAGIGGDEIDAMIANADGQGPEVNFADYETA